MDSVLKQILKETKQSVQDNKKLVEENKVLEQQAKEERKTNQYNSTSREVIMIQSLGLTIDTYEPADPNDEYYEAHDYYYCSNERWSVTIRDMLYDADLGTILQVLDLTDKVTDEKVDFYCDLWCRNTHKIRLEQLKYLLSHTKQEYIDHEFKKYYTIPKLLRERGYVVEEENYEFDADKCLGKLKIKNSEITNKFCILTISHYYGISTYLQEEKKKYGWDDKVSICW
jgi:hypothetical protein